MRIRRAHTEDYEACCALLETHLGMVTIEPSEDDTWFVCEVDEHIVGIGAAEIYYDGYGFLKALVVDPAYRRRGIGDALTRHRIDYLKQKGARAIGVTCWCYGPGPYAQAPSAALLERYGFVCVERLENYYGQILNETGEQCPLCGSTCWCDAILMQLELVLGSGQGSGFWVYGEDPV